MKFVCLNGRINIYFCIDWQIDKQYYGMRVNIFVKAKHSISVPMQVPKTVENCFISPSKVCFILNYCLVQTLFKLGIKTIKQNLQSYVEHNKDSTKKIKLDPVKVL